MITLNFEKASAWLAFIIGIIVGIVVGFFGQPYVMEAFNNSLVIENQVLKHKVMQLEEQFLKSSEEENGVEITLSSCQKESIQLDKLSIACQFIITQPYDFIMIYAYGTVLKSQQNVISHIETVQTTGEVSILKTEEGEISSWKFLTPSAVPFTVHFQVPIEMDTVTGSIELFVKADQKQATTVKFAPINIELGVD